MTNTPNPVTVAVAEAIAARAVIVPPLDADEYCRALANDAIQAYKAKMREVVPSRKSENYEGSIWTPTEGVLLAHGWNECRRAFGLGQES